MDVAWRATHVCSFCFRMHLDQIRPKQLVKLFIFELMNLIHNHWGKSFEARNREIFLPRLTAGKIIRNQDEQGQLSWGLGSCCLNFCNRLHIHLLASLPRRYPCVHIASARLDWSASDKMDVSWVYPAWHSNEPNVKTSHQLICRCSCRSVL